MIDGRQVVEYNILEVNGAIGIKVESGEFSDVITTVSNVSVQDDESSTDGNAVLSFNFDVVYDAEKPKELFETVDFKNTIGDILLNLITENMENEIESEYINTEESSL
jgi:hypothetical protein